MAITLQDVSRFYTTPEGFLAAVNQVNLNIEDGEFLIISGRSGSGKTTMLNLISGLIQPTRGKISVNGEDLSQLRDRDPGFAPILSDTYFRILF
jgi:ABC-type lipoprotein export system ATPase subunit